MHSAHLSGVTTRTDARTDARGAAAPSVDHAQPASSAPPEAQPGIGRHWAPADYQPRVFGGGADKLADSAVAPLVAIARGGHSLTWVSPKDTTAQCQRLGIDKRRGQGRRFAEELQLGDILVMPWYLADRAVRAQRLSAAPGAASIQYRPARPSMSADGSRELKYEFVQGDDSILGVHPASPGDWYSDPSVPLLIAEGQIKADSTLTGILLAAGVDPDDLRLTDAEKALDADTMVLAAQRRLLAMIASIPAERRVCIVAVAGVYNWRKNPEWTMFALSGRDVWVSIDGDVATNWNVWNAASQLCELLGRRMRDVAAAPSVSNAGGGGKVGADDFLAGYGTWDDLRVQLARPAGAAAAARLRQGRRVPFHDNGPVLEKSEGERDETGEVIRVMAAGGPSLPSTARWSPRQ